MDETRKEREDSMVPTVTVKNKKDQHMVLLKKPRFVELCRRSEAGKGPNLRDGSQSLKRVSVGE